MLGTPAYRQWILAGAGSDPNSLHPLELDTKPPVPPLGSQESMTSTYTNDQIPKPCKTVIKRPRRGAQSSGPNQGHAKLVVPLLFVNGESLCKLQDVIDAIHKTNNDEIGHSHRGYEDFLKLKNVIPAIRNNNSLISYFSSGDLWRVDEEHPDDGTTWELISLLSSLCTFPLIIMKIFQKVKLPGKFQHAKEDPLLLTFALRNVLARLAFHTKLQNTIRVTLRKELKEKGYELVPPSEARPNEITTDAISTFVGFNRLLSPNNKTGVSYSSDLDYKLIIDCRELRNKNDEEPLTKEQIKNLVQKLNKAQQEVKVTFDRDAKMLLEVADFTTRDLAELEKYLGEDEREKNFLASIYRNNIHIAGSGSVYRKFQKLLDDYEESNGLEIARRTWVQYLGPSDKGSVMWISKAAELKTVFDNISEIIISHFSSDDLLVILRKAFKDSGAKGQRNFDTTGLTYYHEETKEETKEETNLKDWLSSPMILKASLKNTSVSDFLVRGEGKDKVIENLQVLNIFPAELPLQEQLSIAMKVFTGLVDDGVYEPNAASKCLMHIGSTLSTEEDWRFSLKYAGCRLNDFYDSVQLSDYKKWYNGKEEEEGKYCEEKYCEEKYCEEKDCEVKDSEVEDRYYIGKAIASVINEFALRMQNFIYLLAAIPDKNFKESTGKSHEDIDALYSRMTKARFHEMIIRSTSSKTVPGNVDIIKALDRLKKDIDLRRLFDKANDLFHYEISTHYPRSLNESIQKVQLETGNLLTAIKTDPFGANGKALFDSIFELVMKSSNFLKPQ